jgi:alpha-tubulin suppressor-like RCC1 family protein
MRIQNICWGGSYQNSGGTFTYTNITMLLDNGTTSRLVGAGSNNWGSLGNGTLTDSRVPVAPNSATGLTGRVAKIASCGNSPKTVYALLSTGVLYSWGYNEFGAVGNGSTTNQQNPLALSVNVLDILGDVQGWDFNGYFSPSPFVKKADGYYACGYNGYGNLGDGSDANKNTLVKLRVPKNTAFKFFATYGNNEGLARLAITEQNTIYAWGYNNQAQIDPDATSWSAVQPLLFTPNAIRT